MGKLTATNNSSHRDLTPSSSPPEPACTWRTYTQAGAHKYIHTQPHSYIWSQTHTHIHICTHHRSYTILFFKHMKRVLLVYMWASLLLRTAHFQVCDHALSSSLLALNLSALFQSYILPSRGTCSIIPVFQKSTQATRRVVKEWSKWRKETYQLTGCLPGREHDKCGPGNSGQKLR